MQTIKKTLNRQFSFHIWGLRWWGDGVLDRIGCSGIDPYWRFCWQVIINGFWDIQIHLINYRAKLKPTVKLGNGLEVGCVNNSRSLKQDKEIFFKLSLDQEYSIHPVISVVISEIILQFLFKNATTKRDVTMQSPFILFKQR